MSDEKQTLEEQLAPISNFKVSYSDFEKEKQIGKGAYSEVYLAIHTPTQIRTALKVLTAKELQGTQRTYFVREVFILATIQNPFLVQFLGYTDTYPYCIVTQFVECGSLYDALNHSPSSPTLSNTDKTNIAMCIAYGMNSLHKCQIIHRDLKSLNILLDSNSLPKIIDFGISRFHTSKSELNTTTIGTPHWMAPEMFNSSNYDEKVDVYSYGVLLWEMLTGGTPFDGLTPFQIMTAVCQNAQRPQIPEDSPEGLTNLINACWAQDPTDRPSFEEVFQQFVSHEVYFEDTNHEVVQSLIEFIGQYEQQVQPSQIEIPPEPQPEPPQPLAQPPKPPSTPDAATRTRIVSPAVIARSMPRKHSFSKHKSIQPPLPSRKIRDDKSNASEWTAPDHHHHRSKRHTVSKGSSLSSMVDVSRSIGSFELNEEPGHKRKRQSFSQGLSSILNKDAVQSHDSMRPRSISSNPFRPYTNYETTSTCGTDDSSASGFDKLENPKAHGYKHHLKSIASKLTPDSSLSFFRCVANNLTVPDISDRTLYIIVRQLSKLCKRDPRYVVNIVESNCVTLLPFNKPLLTDLILTIVLSVAKECPGYVPISGLQTLLEYIKGREHKFVMLLIIFHRTINNHPTFEPIIHLYLSKSLNFLESYECYNYLNILYSIYLTNPHFVFISKIFILALETSTNPKLIQLSYNALCSIKFNIKDLPIETVLLHFNEFPYEVTSLLSRISISYIPTNNEFVVLGLIKSIQYTKIAVFLLCKIIMNDSKNAKILIKNNNKWINNQTIAINYQFKLFLSIFIHKKLRKLLIQIPNLIDMFIGILEYCSLDALHALVTILRMINNEFPDFLGYLSESEFLKKFFHETFTQNNNDVVYNGILLLDNICRIGYVNDYVEIIKYFPNMLKMSTKIKDAIIGIMIILCHYQQTLEYFRQYNLPQIVKKCQLSEKGNMYRSEFLKFFEK
ncbi:TKL family protein kinase [Histomonas meleagridis]|uniref:TKL family protein kinase n=1 Tax=Histomonas meleagridis TaxID=135588 RepID=UPI003559FB58|nr:TKL family protein kinase [Histomonas meleagridis]KAH0804772.1 TKL family protein kinase [Histomonas meleagridis]